MIAEEISKDNVRIITLQVKEGRQDSKEIINHLDQILDSEGDKGHKDSVNSGRLADKINKEHAHFTTLQVKEEMEWVRTTLQALVPIQDSVGEEAIKTSEGEEGEGDLRLMEVMKAKDKIFKEDSAREYSPYIAIKVTLEAKI